MRMESSSTRTKTSISWWTSTDLWTLEQLITRVPDPKALVLEVPTSAAPTLAALALEFPPLEDLVPEYTTPIIYDVIIPSEVSCSGMEDILHDLPHSCTSTMCEHLACA
jgi:hypothetical protein